MKSELDSNRRETAAMLEVAEQTRSPKLNLCGFAIYCTAVVAAIIVWVSGTDGLGPIDDHHFIRTIFQGNEFGSYVMPELGRFFPLTSQEYILAAKLFGPSGQLFYCINALKIILLGGLLFYCLAQMGLGILASAILWSTAIFSMGIANTLFRLHAGDLNALILMLVFTLCILKLHDRQDSEYTWHKGHAIIGGIAFLLALFYKELIFVFGLIFALSEILRAYWIKKSRASVFILVILLISVAYIMFYGIWRYVYVTGSYAEFHSTSSWNVITLFAISDPFIILMVLPVTAYRVTTFLRNPECYSIYDSMLVAACAYVSAYILLGMFNTYYLLPAYAFSICGLAGVLVSFRHNIPRHVLLIIVSLFCVNIFPVVFSDIQAKKLIINNHFKFVNYLSGWLQEQPVDLPRPRYIVLAGVSPGSGVEILLSLDTFLASLGAPRDAFEIKATELSDNKTISDFHGFQAKEAYTPKVHDLLVFNPFQKVVSHPPLEAPSYKEIYRSENSWALPRWMGWQWVKHCLLYGAECLARVNDNMIYVGYAAMLVNRPIVPVAGSLPLEKPAYRLGSLNLPSHMKAGMSRIIDVLVQNTGPETWPADGTLRGEMLVNLAYRWFDQNNRLVLEGDRSPFPEPIHSKDYAKISIVLKVPALPGTYRLSISPVQEGVRWFTGGDEREIEVF